MAVMVIMESRGNTEQSLAEMVNHALADSRPAGLEGTLEFLLECRRDPQRTDGCAAWSIATSRSSPRRISSSSSPSSRRFGQAGYSAASIPKAGPYTTDAASMYRFVGGRIAERWAVRDDLGMMRQLGAIR